MAIDLFAYWYLFPLGIIIATLYTSTGISGANFWTPIYLLVINLDPLVSFWLALVSMIFGSLGGLIGHSRNGTINRSLVLKYLPVTIPFAVIGALLVRYTNVTYLMMMFGCFVSGYGIYLLYRTTTRNEETKKHEKNLYLPAAAGGILTGLISVGLGKLMLVPLINHRDITSPAMAAGTTLIIVFVTSALAIFFRLNSGFIDSLQTNLPTIISMMIYEIPGILVGSQVGPYLVKRLDPASMKKYVALLLLIIGTLVLVRAYS